MQKISLARVGDDVLPAKTPAIQMNGTGRSQALTPEHARLHGTQWTQWTQRTHWLGEELPPDQAYVSCVRPGIGH
jgi:hypothetical protein